MTPWQECAGSFPAVSYGSSLGSRNVGEVSRVAVLNRDLKGLGFPKVTTESGKAVTAFSYTWFTWPVLGSLRCDTWVVPLTVLNPLRLPGTVPLTPW